MFTRFICTISNQLSLDENPKSSGIWSHCDRFTKDGHKSSLSRGGPRKSLRTSLSQLLNQELVFFHMASKRCFRYKYCTIQWPCAQGKKVQWLYFKKNIFYLYFDSPLPFLYNIRAIQCTFFFSLYNELTPICIFCVIQFQITTEKV